MAWSLQKSPYPRKQTGLGNCFRLKGTKETCQLKSVDDLGWVWNEFCKTAKKMGNINQWTE